MIRFERIRRLHGAMGGSKVEDTTPIGNNNNTRVRGYHN